MIIDRTFEDGKFWKLSPNSSKEVYNKAIETISAEASLILDNLADAVAALEAIQLPMQNESGESVVNGCRRYADHACAYWVARGRAAIDFLDCLPNSRQYDEYGIKFRALAKRCGF